MPLFRRGPVRPEQPKPGRQREGAHQRGRGARASPVPRCRSSSPPPPPAPPTPPRSAREARPRAGPARAVFNVLCDQHEPDPLGPYYRYEFLRPLFPDYPRPAVWPDGYYIPTSTGDDVIQKHACVVDRDKMLKGEPATEQCIIIDGVNFLNNADIDGKGLPPAGAPNIMMAAGGTQLEQVLEDDGSMSGSFTLTGRTPPKQSLTDLNKSTVAPYHYLCGGQLTELRAAAGHRSTARLRRATRSWRGWSTEDRQPRIDRCRSFGQHVGRWWRRALV